MNIFEFLLVALALIVVGFWGIMYMAGKYGLIDDEEVREAIKNQKNKRDKKDE